MHVASCSGIDFAVVPNESAPSNSAAVGVVYLHRKDFWGAFGTRFPFPRPRADMHTCTRSRQAFRKQSNSIPRQYE